MSSGSNGVDMKSAGVYVAAVLGATLVLELAAYFAGAIRGDSSLALKCILLAILFVVPAVGARVSGRVAANLDERRPKYWPIPWKAFWLIVAGVPAVFLATNAMEVALGWTSLDLSFYQVANRLPEDSEIASSSLLVLAIVLDFVLVVAVYTPVALGYEYGWRVHFGTRLKPLGRLRAYAITGLLSGVCFVPLVFSDVYYIAHPPIAAARILLLVAVLGAVSSEILRIGGNATLCAVFAGVFFSQAIGTMNFIFPLRRLDYGGPFGWLSIGVWALVLIAVSRLSAKRQSE